MNQETSDISDASKTGAVIPMITAWKFGRCLLASSHAGTRLPIADLQDSGRSPSVRHICGSCFLLSQKKKQENTCCGILLSQSKSISYGGIIHIRYKGRRSHLPLSQFSEYFRCKLPCIFSYKIKTGDNPLAPPVKNPCI